jgi:ABC-type multidrug transport system ATPase subunit
MDESLIVCDNLVEIYKVANLEVVALQGLDLAIRRGEMLGVVGAGGSGKSSLLNILGGLDRPSAGRVWVDRADVGRRTASSLSASCPASRPTRTWSWSCGWPASGTRNATAARSNAWIWWD